jgi:hypothetical protein
MAPPDELPLVPVPSHGVTVGTEDVSDPAASLSPGRLNWMAICFLALFAALLASFPARNSDLWIHLAAGRELARGQSPFEAARLSAGDRAPSTWLYDLLSYGVYSALGGPGLVVCKVLVVVGLALLLLRLSRAGPGWGIPTACTALALLAMSTRLLVQPTTVSYLFLALTLLFLPLREQVEANRTFLPRPPWPLLILFLVWVNMDSLFVVGLGTVTLVWLGRAMDLTRRGDKETGRKEERTPGALALQLLGSLAILGAVCLLNPSHVFAFLPSQWEWFGSSFASASFPASGQVTSPFQRAYFANFWQSPAGLAYFPLLGLGLLSFVLNPSRWSWQRFLPWVGLALLSALQARAIPFFAVVAGPVLAWNLQAWGARLDIPRPIAQPLRVVTVSLGLILLLCAWPGWLQGLPYEPRQWAVQTSPSLEGAPKEVKLWYQEGRLAPDVRGLHLSPETYYAFDRFCPEEKKVLDDGLALAVRGDPQAPEDWDERMRSAGVNHVIVYDSNRERRLAVLERLFGDSEQWPLLHLEGDLAIFGWRDPAKKGQGSEAHFRDWQENPNRLAFQPAKDKKAPQSNPNPDPEPRHWWDAFWKPIPHSSDTDEARLRLLHAETLKQSSPIRLAFEWQANQYAALAGASGGWQGLGGLCDVHLRLALFRPPMPELSPGEESLPAITWQVSALQRKFNLERDYTSPALLYLAVRSARRALAINPDDAEAYWVLGESYLRLLKDTRERMWALRLPDLAKLRQAQAISALNQAATLKPDLAEAHLSLFELYRDLGFLDLALEHLRAHQKLSGRRGPNREQALSLEEELDKLAKSVAERETAYASEAPRLRVADRAKLAFDKRLAGKARDLLLASDVSAFGDEGVEIELELLLRTGRANKVRDWTRPEQKSALGATTYHWLRVQALAASGDYTRAREECEQLASVRRGREPEQLREMMAGLIGQEILDEQPVGASMLDLPARAFGRIKFLNRVAGLANGLKDDANAKVFQGLLALEEGDVEEARVAFTLALDLWKDEAAAATGAGLDFAARPIAEGYLYWLK